MTIYFMFGKTGAGKSYIGRLLEQLKVLHIDGDSLITQAMRECLANDEQMTPEMIDDFADVLIQAIHQQKQRTPYSNFAISQALYLDRHRLKILSAFPELRFVLIDAPQALRESRIIERFSQSASTITLDYATEMDTWFEAPSHEVIYFNNSRREKLQLIAQIIQTMPGLIDKT